MQIALGFCLGFLCCLALFVWYSWKITRPRSVVLTEFNSRKVEAQAKDLESDGSSLPGNQSGQQNIHRFQSFSAAKRKLEPQEIE